MTFYEMIKAIHEGKARKFGRSLRNVFEEDRNVVYDVILDPYENETITSEDIFADDWEILEDDWEN